MSGPAATAAARLTAFVWDSFLIIGYAVALGLAELIAYRVSGHWLAPRGGPIARDLFAFMTLVLPVTVYFGFSEAGCGGASWGKRQVGLRVLTVQGTPLSLRQSLARSSLKFLPWQIAHTCMFQASALSAAAAMPPWIFIGFGLSYLIVGMDVAGLFLSKRQTLYDVFAGTTVVVRTTKTKR